ncbi:hypothetical protein BDQ17DRAFT_1324278 [Cyathus striatus]|nr:hypothetical protein BDQ17DRAFT_1324278 [Cyathus striatus]
MAVKHWTSLLVVLSSGLLQIRTWQNAQPGGCPSRTCAYFEWNGKSNSECSSDTTFLSLVSVPIRTLVELVRALTSSYNLLQVPTTSCYADPNLPINRIHLQLIQAFPTGIHRTPADDQSCELAATDDVFACVVNGISEADFVTIEQDAGSRDPTNWGRWSNVISLALLAI